MRSWWDWIKSRDLSRPWLILGKGPSFSRRHEFDTSGYHTLGLNHVVRGQQVDVAHAIDVEVIQQVPADKWLQNAGVLVMPWHPHQNSTATSKTLPEWVSETPILRQLDKHRRLLWYNLVTGERFQDGPSGPVVGVKFFSVEAVLNLLAGGGVKTIRTLGIDGGAHYASEFADLRPLTNGRRTFDDQQQEITRIVRVNHLDYAAASTPMGGARVPESLLREYYLLLARSCSNMYAAPLVLKTDAWNEAKGVPRPGGIAGNIRGQTTLVECDANLIEPARHHCPGSTVIRGDIRELGFPSEQFDCVFDFSTIDHIPANHVAAVLGGYHRVLRSGGIAVVVAWCSRDAADLVSETPDDPGPDHQFYFSPLDLQNEINARFSNVVSQETIFVRGHRFLELFVLKK